MEKYIFELVEEGTGDHICNVEIDQQTLEFIIQKGFIEVIKEYIEKQETKEETP